MEVFVFDAEVLGWCGPGGGGGVEELPLMDSNTLAGAESHLVGKYREENRE